MNKSELESKHISELHALAADAGVERYRMLSRAELIEKLADGGGGAGSKPKGDRGRKGDRGGKGDGDAQGDRGRQPGRRQRGRGGDRGRSRGPREERPRERPQPERGAAEQERRPAPEQQPAPERPKRRRRRRRWGRRRKSVRVHDLLLPAASGRQAIVYAESRAACTALLREIAAELADASKGPDPIALLVDPSPEELADWKREAPKAELVSAGKANHAEDAIAQARARAGSEDVIVLIDSLSRFAEAFGGADDARDLFDAGTGVGGGNGSLTIVAAIERTD